MNATPIRGLTRAEVAERVRRGEVNRTRQSHAAEYLAILRRNLLTVFNGLVTPAAVMLFWLGNWRDGIAVSGFALLNTLIGLAQEVRAKRHLDRLAILAEVKARVLRDQEITVIPAGDVVLGDHLWLAAGDPVVADGTVLEARFLEIDEALLTGESDPVRRHVGDRLLSGSYCVAGEGTYRADKVGSQAFANDLTVQARAYRFAASPLQLSINWLITILTIAAIFLCGFYWLLHMIQGYEQEVLWERVAATITSMVPVGLVLMATMAFTLGAVRMATRGAVVQRLSAVETMAAVDVLCMDKTGTLTTNRLRLDRLFPLNPALTEEAVRERLRLFAAASLDHANRSILALRAGLGEPRQPVECLDLLPFKSQNRSSAVRVRAGQGEHCLVLGACEALRPHLSNGAGNDWETTWNRLEGSGLRLLLFAESPEPKPFNGSLEGFSLSPLALVALSDELRPEAGAVLEALAAQGITFKILSGDNPLTVQATISRLPLKLKEEPAVSGDDLRATKDLAALLRDRSVFGRVSPQQKIQIVATLQKLGHHVAMIGDGVNDVLPIKQAHLGIAMGDGSAAAKTVSALVLENNNFALLPHLLDEGRTIVRNLLRSGKLFLVKNVYTLFLIVGALGLLGLDFPYLPRQVTLLNLLTIGIPAFVITLGREHSTAATKLGFLGEVLSFAVRSGLVIGAAGLMIFWLAARVRGDDLVTQRTLLLSTLVLLGLTSLLRVLNDGEARPLVGDTKYRWLAAAAVPAYLAIMYWPLSADFFQLAALTISQWGLVLAVAAPGSLICWFTDWLARWLEEDGELS